MSRPQTAVLIGNPSVGSRTAHAALHVHRELVGADPDLVVELAAFGPRLLDWSDLEVKELVTRLGAADLVVVASPTFKAGPTGLLKVFLDRFAGGTGLRGWAVPLMLGGSREHALSVEHVLRPVLSELGAATTTGLYLTDTDHDRPEAYAPWLERVRRDFTTAARLATPSLHDPESVGATR